MHCLHCGRPFVAFHPARYCGEECKRASAVRRGTTNETPAVCAVCGRELSAERRRRAARYCSETCKGTAAQRRLRAKEKVFSEQA